MIHPNWDLNEHELRKLLLDTPARARRLYPRGGFEGLEPNQLQVLLAIDEQQGRSVGEVAERLSLGQGTVSTAVTRLADAELVHVEEHARDARRRSLQSTSKGQELLARFVVETMKQRRN